LKIQLLINISLISKKFGIHDNIFPTYEKFFPNDISSHYFNFVIVKKWKEIVPHSGAPPPPACTPMAAMIHGVSIPNTNA
jgi:hypothetical protein